ncbi:hypothetical protein E2C01_013565 [Portunus trituberculatus]|uniref:Uncharacterized protein n=1 Tax=Portunus trituberculatus TaxID=210409 RepID=A0A5B7DGL2_PORTR|nr:hypothetical protein [Portunus trituberculatus]
MVSTPSADSAAATFSGSDNPGMENRRSNLLLPFSPVTMTEPSSAFTSSRPSTKSFTSMTILYPSSSFETVAAWLSSSLITLRRFLYVWI